MGNNRFFSLKYMLLITALFVVIQLNGQTAKKGIDTTFTRLQEVVVTGIIKDKKLSAISENIQVLSQKEITENDGLNYQYILNQVPGVFMQSGSLNTNRITIRGIGARSPFGTTSIRAYFGEIPLTDGNGVSSIEDFELASISTIEVHKGPSASSFGVGLGGAVFLKHKNLYVNSLSLSTESVYGSFGLVKNSSKFKYATKEIATTFVYSNTQSDGYRENNSYDRETFTATTSVRLSSKDELQFLGNYTNLKAFIPSALNLDTYTTNPKSAAFTWANAQGFEDFQSFLTGLSWQHAFSSTLQLNSSIFATGKKNYEPRPFNILKEKTNGFGIRSRVSKNTRKIKWGFGGEFFYDTNQNSTFENLYEAFPLGTGSVMGEQLSAYKEHRSYLNVFGEFSYTLHEKWAINAGININKTGYKIEDLFFTGTENQSGKYNFNVIASPKVGMLFHLNNHIKIRTSIAHGFSPPTTEETLLPSGLINTELVPEQGWNFELGSNFSFLKNRLYGDISIYNLKVNDLLVNRRAINDALFAVNAGKTNHLGLEGSLNYRLLKSESLAIDGFVNGSIYRYRFEDFLDDSEDFSGNKLTGVPDVVFNLGIRFKTAIGFYGNINFQHVGAMPANDANTVFSEAYQLTNTKLGYQITLKERFKIHTFGGVNNLLNEKYASQLQVNAGSFGGSAPRYYYAGNPINYYGGVKIEYLFF